MACKCSEDSCSEPARARGLRKRHYDRARYARTLGALGSTAEYHRLTNIDEAAETATCSICGPTRVRIRPGRTACWTKVQEHGSGGNAQTRRQRRLAKYGMSPSEYEALFASQGRRCAICRRKPDSHKRSFPVDHCHDTGQVRGILCGACNTALGLANDSTEVLHAMIGYLHRAQQGALFWEGEIGA